MITTTITTIIILLNRHHYRCHPHFLTILIIGTQRPHFYRCFAPIFIIIINFILTKTTIIIIIIYFLFSVIIIDVILKFFLNHPHYHYTRLLNFLTMETTKYWRRHLQKR